MSRLWYASDCADVSKPDEVFLYELQAIPLVGRSPFTPPLEWSKAISKHLVESCGLLPTRLLEALADGDGKIDVSQLPQPARKLFRPYRGEQSRFNNAAQWIPVAQEEPEPVRIQDPAEMTVREREAQVERLRYLGYKVNEPDPEAPRGATTTLPRPPKFDPGEHSVAETISYLRNLDTTVDADAVEKGRVLAAERTGKARNGILKRWPEGTT